MTCSWSITAITRPGREGERHGEGISLVDIRCFFHIAMEVVIKVDREVGCCLNIKVQGKKLLKKLVLVKMITKRITIIITLPHVIKTKVMITIMVMIIK